jgi:hypothetical protein
MTGHPGKPFDTRLTNWATIPSTEVTKCRLLIALQKVKNVEVFMAHFHESHILCEILWLRRRVIARLAAKSLRLTSELNH